MNHHHLFDYNAWANREEVAHMRSSAPPERGLRILAHIIGAEWLWLGRIRGDPKPAVVWPELSLDECASQIESLAAEWKRLVDIVDLHTAVDYVNTKGERWTNTVDDILTHVVMHGAYHRGQIATIVRDGGATPAYTDYIQCVRIGAI